MTKNARKTAKPAKPAAKTYILFGTDEYAKPRAARFSKGDPELLAKAVESMHLRLVEVTGEDLAEIAPRLRQAACMPAGKDWCLTSNRTCILT